MKEWAADNPKFNAEHFLKYKGINSNKDNYTTIKRPRELNYLEKLSETMSLAEEVYSTS